MSLPVSMPNGDKAEIVACHKVIQAVLCISAPVWHSLLKAAVHAESVHESGEFAYDDITLDELGLTSEQLQQADKAARITGRSEVREVTANWIIAYAQSKGDYNPASGENVVQLDLDCLKLIWEQDYCEDVRSMVGDHLNYKAFREVWLKVAEGNYHPGSPKIVFRIFKRNAGICNDCANLREMRRGIGQRQDLRATYEKAWALHNASHRDERRYFYERRHEFMLALCLWAFLQIVIDKMDKQKSRVPFLSNGSDVWKQVADGVFPFSWYACVVHGWKALFYCGLPYLLTKGQTGSLTVTMLMDALSLVCKAEPWAKDGRPMPPDLHVQVDGGSENRNNTVLCWAGMLVATGMFKNVFLHRLLRGHSHCDPDQMFGIGVGYMKDGRSGLECTPYATLEAFIGGWKDAFKNSDADPTKMRHVPDGTMVRMLAQAYNVAAWIAKHKDKDLAGWANSADFCQDIGPDSIPYKGPASAKPHHTHFRKAEDGRAYFGWQLLRRGTWFPVGFKEGQPMYTEDGEVYYGCRVFAPGTPMEDLETPPPWCPFDADWFKNELPRIKRVIAGIPGNPNLRRYFSSCMPELLSWGDWLDKLPRQPGAVPVEWEIEPWLTPAMVRAIRGRAPAAPTPELTRDERLVELATEAARIAQPLVEPVRHAGFTQAAWERANHRIELQVASRTACDALKAGDSVLAVLPEHVASSPTWTPVVYATVASVVPPQVGTEGQRYELECFRAPSYFGKWQRWSPHSAICPPPRGVPKHTFQVAPSSILLSTWNKGKKKYAVSLSKDGVLLKNTRDAIANTPALVTAMKWDGYVSQQATEDSASRAFQDLVAGGIPVGTRVCAMFQARREHGRVAAVDAARQMALIRWQDDPTHAWEEESYWHQCSYLNLQSLLCHHSIFNPSNIGQKVEFVTIKHACVAENPHDA
eukprot:jgi/Mesvir1/6999/Mv09136-RA.1